MWTRLSSETARMRFNRSNQIINFRYDVLRVSYSYEETKSHMNSNLPIFILVPWSHIEYASDLGPHTVWKWSHNLDTDLYHIKIKFVLLQASNVKIGNLPSFLQIRYTVHTVCIWTVAQCLYFFLPQYTKTMDLK